MPPERTTTDEKLARILKSAAEIFADKGYHQASIRDISRATGISLSGLYYYVQSKEEILFLIQDHCFGTITARLDGVLAGVEDPRRRLALLIENHLRFFVHNMAEMKVLSHEAESLGGEYRERVNARKKAYARVATGILEGIDGGEVDARVATFALFGMMNWIYNWYRPERDVPVDRLAADMTRLFLRGYLSADGQWAPAEADAGSAEPTPSIWRDGYN